MAGNAIADAGFLVALLRRRDRHHAWAAAQAERYPPPWKTCEAALSEAFYLLGPAGVGSLSSSLRRGMVKPVFEFSKNMDAVLALMDKYRQVPMSLADACLVRMTELLNDPVVLATDHDFRIYRRHGRQIVPDVLPSQ